MGNCFHDLLGCSTLILWHLFYRTRDFHFPACPSLSSFAREPRQPLTIFAVPCIHVWVQFTHYGVYNKTFFPSRHCLEFSLFYRSRELHNGDFGIRQETHHGVAYSTYNRIGEFNTRWICDFSGVCFLVLLLDKLYIMAIIWQPKVMTLICKDNTELFSLTPDTGKNAHRNAGKFHEFLVIFQPILIESPLLARPLRG